MVCGVMWCCVGPVPPATGKEVGIRALRDGGDGGSPAALSSQLWSCLRCRREAALARRAEPMLDLEVVPERSLGNEQWEFTLGKCGCWVLPRDPIFWSFSPYPSRLWSLAFFSPAPASSPLPSFWLFGSSH